MPIKTDPFSPFGVVPVPQPRLPPGIPAWPSRDPPITPALPARLPGRGINLPWRDPPILPRLPGQQPPDLPPGLRPNPNVVVRLRSANVSIPYWLDGKL